MNAQVEQIFVIDDFYPFPDKLREFALAQTYIDWRGPDGEIYKRICLIDIPGLTNMLRHIFGSIEMLGQAFRLNYNGEEPNSSIHSDVGWGTHALVLYLSKGESGTAFWRHKKTGTVRIELGDEWLFEQIAQDWNNPDAWEKRRFVPMEFNRAVIYESAFFHSRFPFEAFGNSAKNGRLIAVAFFNVGVKK